MMEVEAQPINSSRTNSPPNEDEEKIMTLDIDENRPQYGNLVVLFKKGPFMISLGPDYLCFLPTFIFLVAIGILLIRVVSESFKNPNIIIFAYGASILQCGSYLLVALSNPSVALRQNNRVTTITNKNIHKFCSKCGVFKERYTRHCRDCDVCIQGYDHHCPWVSKCIGKGNLCFFYAFISITPFYIICFMGLMMASLVNIALESSKQNLRTHN